MKEDFLHKKLEERRQQNVFRNLKLPLAQVDFCSNDYLGIVKNDLLKSAGRSGPNTGHKTGSTGSRLLTGNYALIEETEKFIASFHKSEAGLIFNSGYDANLGLLSSVPGRGDTVLYDYLSHASIRDGIRLSLANSISFLHNDINDLEKKLQRAKGNIFVVTESVFSVDGDLCPLLQLVELCEKYNANLIIDEAHATGVIGSRGEGLVQSSELENRIFARVHTFGKACGVHGAVILGSQNLRDYLINFARPFIYSTALPEETISRIRKSYEIFPLLDKDRENLRLLVNQFQNASLVFERLNSMTPIQGIVIPGNEKVKLVAEQLQRGGLDVRPIIYPTVPKGRERLRIVLHAFNTQQEVQCLVKSLEGCKI